MSEPIQSISQGNYILATQQEVSHDNTLSGTGMSDSPLCVNSNSLFVSTVETLGTYNISNNADTKISASLTKVGYKPIAWNVRLGYAGLINYNDELSEINDDTLNIVGYARGITGSYNSISFKAAVTWVKA